MNTKAPLHGTWRPGEKDDDDVTCFGANINILAYWSKKSNKVARLRHLFQEYEVDTAGLQEICVNWAKLGPPKTIAEFLRSNAEQIRPVVSHTKIEGKRKGMGQTQ